MEPYERLLGDAMAGDATLFARQDVVEAAWAHRRSGDPLRRRPMSIRAGHVGPARGRRAGGRRRRLEHAARHARHMNARALWTIGPGRGEIRDETLPPPGAGDVLVETLYSGVSRGTESLVFAGRVPAERARAHARAAPGAAASPFPSSTATRTSAASSRGPTSSSGASSSVCIRTSRATSCRRAPWCRCPTACPPARAVLAANLETAINGVWDAELRVGDRVAVVGGGVVGCLVAYLAARIAGCRGRARRHGAGARRRRRRARRRLRRARSGARATPTSSCTPAATPPA